MANEHQGSGMPRKWLERRIIELQRQLQKTQEALDSSLAMQQEDEQTMGEMRALLEEAQPFLDRDYVAAVRIAQEIRVYLLGHPAPEAGGLEADDDE